MSDWYDKLTEAQDMLGIDPDRKEPGAKSTLSDLGPSARFMAVRRLSETWRRLRDAGETEQEFHDWLNFPGREI